MNFRLSILYKGLILIAVPLLVQVVFIALLAKMRRDGASAVDWTIHTKEVISQAQLGLLAIFEAHGAVQGYVITRDPLYEGIFDRSAGRIPGEMKALRDLVIDREDQTRAASRIEGLATEFASFLEVSRKLVRDGQIDLASAKTRRIRAQQMLDALGESFARFIAFERELDVERQGTMLESRDQLNRLLLGGMAYSLLFSVILAIVFARNISGRIAHLTENTHRLAGGKPLTPPISGGDEIAHLDQVFHEMAGSVAEAARLEKEHAKILERRAEELDTLNGQLREKVQENEMFVYSVSHDLRSPLVNLQGFGKELAIIGKDLGKLVQVDGVPAEVRDKARAMIETDMAESIGFIQAAVTRLSGIIDGLLRLSRAGQVEYRRQPVEVQPLVNRVVSALRGTIEERKATVEVGPLPPAVGDSTAIEQVFANLIGNAINYLDRKRPGRVEVFTVEPAELDELVDGIAPNSVVYVVRDNGLGISDSYKSKVFSVFQRLHGDVAKGEGVGLALARRIVERQGGRIWFKSIPGEGSSFFVAFPRPEPQGLQSQPVDDEPVASSKPTMSGRTA